MFGLCVAVFVIATSIFILYLAICGLAVYLWDLWGKFVHTMFILFSYCVNIMRWVFNVSKLYTTSKEWELHTAQGVSVKCMYIFLLSSIFGTTGMHAVLSG